MNIECNNCRYKNKCEVKRLCNWGLIECKIDNGEVLLKITEKGKRATENLDFNNTTKH